MIFEPVEGDTTDEANIESRLRELLFLFVDSMFDVMNRHRNGEEIKPAHLNVVRQFLGDMGIDYKDALAESRAEQMLQNLSHLPDFKYFKAKYGGDDET